MRISVLVVAAAMLLAVPAFAQVETLPPPETTGTGVTEPQTPATSEETAPATTEEQAPAATEAAVEPELVCRTVTARTESRLRSSRQRVCKTQAEWDAQDAAASRSN
jgi:hypothetical protein